jgi:hypothetical protein
MIVLSAGVARDRSIEHRPIVNLDDRALRIELAVFEPAIASGSYA